MIWDHESLQNFLEKFNSSIRCMITIQDVVDAAGGPYGTCYIVAEVLQFLLGPDKWKPEFVHYRDSTHWYLRHRVTREILDATVGQYSVPPPYHEGKGCGFLTKNPSKRARYILLKLGIR
jgi:hypothetical protein